MDNLLLLMDNPDMDNLLLLTMAINHKDLQSSMSIMMTMMEPPACSVEQTPLTSLEEKLDAWPLLGVAACCISQVFFAVYHAAWMDARMCSLYV